MGFKGYGFAWILKLDLLWIWLEAQNLNFQGDPNIFRYSTGHFVKNEIFSCSRLEMTATAGSDGVQSGRPIFDDFFQHLWPYIGNNTANAVFQMIKRLWLIRIDQ
ncbi:hypothetical protein TNCV_793141 [Trichonephila clavipes]|nr:hypothetical protein TNCV_793141 [Trichonephila clavipes]